MSTPAAQSLDPIGHLQSLAIHAFSDLKTSFSTESAILQLVAIVVACLISLVIYRYLRRHVYQHMPPAKSPTLLAKIKRAGFLFLKSIAFSVTASILLWVATLLLGLSSVPGKLLLVRTANQVFFAWAILQILLVLLTASFGHMVNAPIVRKTVSVLFWICAVLQISSILPDIIAWMNSVSLPIGSTRLTLWSCLTGGCMILVTLGAANMLSKLCESVIVSAQLDSNLQVVSLRLMRIALFSMAILLALSWTGIDLTVLSVFSGAIGVGIGFGMQKIAANYISGFIILFDRSVKLGDYIEMSGFAGIVTKINTRYSVIRNLMGEEMIVPNEMFITNSVKNLTLSDKQSAQTVQLSVAYDANVTKAIDIAIDAIKGQPRVLASPAPWAIVTDLGDSGINISASFFIADPQKGTGTLKSNIIREVLRRYAEAGIEIPYNRLDVSIVSAPPEFANKPAQPA